MLISFTPKGKIMKLIIGNQNYSSWSLRPWVLLKHFNLPFELYKISLFTETTQQELAEHTPNSKVPVLIDKELTVWDSLAICEYINSQYLDGQGWPNSESQKAVARSICAEMHSGFQSIRNELPMNCRRKPGTIPLSDECKKDIDRIINIWETCLTNSNSEYLFDRFSIADAFYLPVVTRFISYKISVPHKVEKYMNKMIALPSYQTWLTDAKNEVEVIEVAEK